MRAILIATGYRPDMDPLIGYRPSPLLNIVDKPILFYIIEYLIDLEISHIDLILNHYPEQIEEAVDNGRRWGIHIDTHLVKNDHTPFATIIPTVEKWSNEPVLLGQGDFLPKLTKERLDVNPVFFNHTSGTWTGWGVVSADTLARVPPNIELTNLKNVLGIVKHEIVETFLSTASLQHLRNSNMLLLKKEPESILFPTTAKKIEPGIWLSRAVSIEPGVEITPPVFIGTNSHIKSGAKVGPNVIIENNCLIDSHSVIEDSLICQNSYVGETLHIKDCIIDRNSLINLFHNSHIEIKDDFIISEVSPPSLIQYLMYGIERVIAVIFTIISLPLLSVLYLCWDLRPLKAVRLPTSLKPDEWETFDALMLAPPDKISYHFGHLSELINIIKGEMHFVGLPPRSPEEIRQLPSEWQHLYLKSKVGVISLESVEHGEEASVDERYASECYYASHMSWLLDLKIIWRWFWNKIKRVQDG